MDALDLARWQFGVTTVYHFLFVPLTIGLGIFVAGLQTAWHRTGKEHYLRLTKFFGKLFLINFAMGVVTGIVQEFQFGMNWSEYSRFVGDVFGAPLAMEALLAFFLESTFLGLWIFGWDRLPKRVHLATHLGRGHRLQPVGVLHPRRQRLDEAPGRLRGGRRPRPDDRPVGGAHQLHRARPGAARDRRRLRRRGRVRAGGLRLPACCGAPHAGIEAGDVAQRRAGRAGHDRDRRGGRRGQRRHLRQAAVRAAADEARRRRGPRHDTAGAPFSIVPGIEVPRLLSFLPPTTPTPPSRAPRTCRPRSSSEFGPGDYRPNLPVVFWSFRVMIGFGLATAGLSVLGLWLTRARRIRGPGGAARVGPAGARLVRPAVPARAAAAHGRVDRGLAAREMGRQPWTVMGELLTAASVSPGVSLTEVAVSLTVFTLLYGALAVAEAVLLARHVRRAPRPSRRPAGARPRAAAPGRPAVADVLR